MLKQLARKRQEQEEEGRGSYAPALLLFLLLARQLLQHELRNMSFVSMSLAIRSAP